MVNRPLFHKGTRELESLFQQAKAKFDLKQLEELDHELSFREKPQSIELALRVRAELARYEDVASSAPPPKTEPVLTPQRGPQPTLPFPEKPPPDTPLRDVLLWLESVAKGMTDEQARALRESLKQRFPGFARFAAERGKGE